MRKISNNKGFTLTEVLAVIVILGILSTIGIVSVTNLRKKQETEFDQSQLALLKETAKSYFSDNKSLLPIVNNSTNIVYLKELIENNYLDSMLQYNKKSYDLNYSYVQVRKVGSKYIYTAELCKKVEEGNCAEPVIPNNEGNANIIFNYKKQNNTDMINISNTHYTNTTGIIGISIEDNNYIAAFMYSIYKNGKKVYMSDFIEPGNIKKTEDKIILDSQKYEDGKYNIEITVYNNQEGVTTKKSEKIVIDRGAPTCGSFSTKGTTGDKGWYKSNVELTVGCSDSVSGCMNTKYTSQITSEGSSIGTIKISDKAGNSTTCSTTSSIKIDKTAPTCEISVTGTIETLDWYKPSPVLTLNYSDAGSGVSAYNLSTSSSITAYNMKKTETQGETDGTTWYGTVKDTAGNVGKCSKTVKVKKKRMELGNYVKMTPTSTSYTIPATLTGYASDQTINPSEVNLWRIIRINADGTVDMVSEYTQTQASGYRAVKASLNEGEIGFTGTTGYINYVYTLNLIAQQYQNTKYTVGTRYFGYNGQTPIIGDTSKIGVYPPPWSASTPNNNAENLGGGDDYYMQDYNLVKNVLGGTDVASEYFVASRYYSYGYDYYLPQVALDDFNVRYCNSSMCSSYTLYGHHNGNTAYQHILTHSWSTDDYYRASLRPIVTLKAGLEPTGSGTKDDPYILP